MAYLGNPPLFATLFNLQLIGTILKNISLIPKKPTGLQAKWVNSDRNWKLLPKISGESGP
jgi:hypothetical protein